MVTKRKTPEDILGAHIRKMRAAGSDAPAKKPAAKKRTKTPAAKKTIAVVRAEDVLALVPDITAGDHTVKRSSQGTYIPPQDILHGTATPELWAKTSQRNPITSVLTDLNAQLPSFILGLTDRGRPDRKRLCLIAGTGGVGKTAAIHKAITAAKLEPNAPRIRSFAKISSVNEIHEAVADAEEIGEETVLIFEEASSIFERPRQMDALKQYADPEGLNTSHLVRIILSCNGDVLDAEKIDARMQDHIEPLIRRSHFFDIRRTTRLSMWEHIAFEVMVSGSLKHFDGKHVTASQQDYAMYVFTKEMYNFTTYNFETYLSVLGLTMEHWADIQEFVKIGTATKARDYEGLVSNYDKRKAIYRRLLSTAPSEHETPVAPRVRRGTPKWVSRMRTDVLWAAVTTEWRKAKSANHKAITDALAEGKQPPARLTFEIWQAARDAIASKQVH